MHQHVTPKSKRTHTKERETRQILKRMDAMTRLIHELRADLAVYQILTPPKPAIVWKDLPNDNHDLHS